MPSTPSSADTPASRLSTRLAFLVAGFGVACWAPLVPFARQRLGVDEGVLGLLLLCLGVGSILAMLAAGAWSARHGTRQVILAGGWGLALLLPALAVAPTPMALGAALLLFGGSLGALDVAMNAQAVEVERDAGRPLMSGFHALYSVGGLLGAAWMTRLLSWHVSPLASCALGSALMAGALVLARSGLLRGGARASGPSFVRPRGVVAVLAALAAITFLAEGALLDWSALLLTDLGRLPATRAGLGYLVFSLAMTAGRFGGDAVTARLGDATTMAAGASLAIAGFVVLLLSPDAAVALAGFGLVGLGASNVVPVLFRRAGAQRAMPPGLAIAAISTTGYAGILLGPAAIGLVARHAGLPAAFWGLALLLLAVPLCARRVTAEPA